EKNTSVLQGRDRGKPLLGISSGIMRTFNAVALSAAAAVLLPGAADGFTSSAAKCFSCIPDAGGRATNLGTRRTSQAPTMMMSSYADRLREARAAKAAAAAGGQASPLPSKPAPAATQAS
ncbi:unnamed protein product, partial [Hapterophycus canaliculatus]